MGSILTARKHEELKVLSEKQEDICEVVGGGETLSTQPSPFFMGEEGSAL